MRIVRQVQDLPGQQLFQYLDDQGERRGLSSQDVNDFLREAMCGEFSSKHFRTWGGTKAAAGLFAAMPVPETEREKKIVLNRLIDEVAERLGNTRAICRKCYIHPAVVDAWLAGTLQDGMAAARKSFRKPVEGLDAEETLVLKWLKAREAE